MSLKGVLNRNYINVIKRCSKQLSSGKGAWKKRATFNPIQIQNTLLSVAIITVKRKKFFAHTSSATLNNEVKINTLNNVVKLNTLKTEEGLTHKEQLS